MAGGGFLYDDVGLKMIIGEWSIATNYDSPIDINDKEIKAELARLFKEQLYSFEASDSVVGHFFWTLRMGSGWDPRPTDSHPKGLQVGGTSAFKSAPDYPFKVWSLLEMAEAGIATSLAVSYDGVCDGQPEAPRNPKFGD